MSRPRNVSRKSVISKRLQTELQSLIAFSCYDSNDVLRCGKSAKKQTLIDNLFRLYMPCNKPNDEHVSQVEQLLEGIGVFSCLFERTDPPDIETATSDPNSPPPPPTLVLPLTLHCIEGREIIVGNKSIDKSMLTRRNLTNPVDIKGDTLYRHAKEVEANCKKALAICLSEDSPYRAYNGTFPSGTNRDDYLKWIRTEMYSLEQKAPIHDLIDNNEKTNNDGEEEKESMEEQDDDEVIKLGDEEYFKGFFAFALWGFIPPDGGDKYKSLLMATVVDTTPKSKKENGRRAVKSEVTKDKKYLLELESRGTPASIVAENERMSKLTTLMISGKQEMTKMRLFKCRQSSVEFKLKFVQSRIKELKDDIKELKDDDDSDVDTAKEVKKLKLEIKNTKKTRDELYANWKEVTETEEERRATLDVPINDNCAVTVSSISGSSIRRISPLVKRKLSTTDFIEEKNVPNEIGLTPTEATESEQSCVTEV